MFSGDRCEPTSKPDCRQADLHRLEGGGQIADGAQRAWDLCPNSFAAPCGSLGEELDFFTKEWASRRRRRAS
jgi:hypothetical protein